MTEYIGNTPIASIQSVEVVGNRSLDEIDLIEKNLNLIFDEEETVHQINIDFSLVKHLHPQNATVEEQREELKRLIKNNAVNNSFTFEDFEGFLSIESIDLLESSDSSTYREGHIEATLLDWPKHFNHSQPDHVELEDQGKFGRTFGGSFGGTGSD